MRQYLFPSLPYNGLQREIHFFTMYSVELLKITREVSVILSNLSMGPAVMSSPGESKFTGADHTHGGPGIRNPDGALDPRGLTSSLFSESACRRMTSDYF